MGTDEREYRTNKGRNEEEPDVEAHKMVRATEGGQKEPEDKDDDNPDVEAHYRPDK